MISGFSKKQILALRRYSFLLGFCTLWLPELAKNLGGRTGYPNWFALLPLVVVFFSIPLIDWLIGRDPMNPDQDDANALANDRWYRDLLLAVLVVQLYHLFWAADVFASTELNWVGKIGWALSFGLVSGVVCMNAAHELIHKRGRLEQWAGGLLASTVCYGSFKVEHVRGHHKRVGTPEDASSAEFNQSFYDFLPRAVWRNFRCAWRLESQRLAKHKLPWFHYRNELLWWYAVSLALGLAMGYLYGLAGLLFFLLQSIVAFCLLEVVNYVEHYGLRRRQLPNRRYENVAAHHSWNSDYFLSNMVLFQLQRHSDHHLFAGRPYQTLRHYDESPQLPASYPLMIVLALVPPVWFRVMNPHVEALTQSEPGRIETKPRPEGRLIRAATISFVSALVGMVGYLYHQHLLTVVCAIGSGLALVAAFDAVTRLQRFRRPFDSQDSRAIQPAQATLIPSRDQATVRGGTAESRESPHPAAAERNRALPPAARRAA